jgi:hypothetical protein
MSYIQSKQDMMENGWGAYWGNDYFGEVELSDHVVAATWRLQKSSPGKENVYCRSPGGYHCEFVRSVR